MLESKLKKLEKELKLKNEKLEQFENNIKENMKDKSTLVEENNQLKEQVNKKLHVTDDLIIDLISHLFKNSHYFKKILGFVLNNDFCTKAFFI